MYDVSRLEKSSNSKLVRNSAEKVKIMSKNLVPTPNKRQKKYFQCISTDEYSAGYYVQTVARNVSQYGTWTHPTQLSNIQMCQEHTPAAIQQPNVCKYTTWGETKKG